MVIKTEPMRKRTAARVIALYGTLGGLLLNLKKKVRAISKNIIFPCHSVNHITTLSDFQSLLKKIHNIDVLYIITIYKVFR